MPSILIGHLFTNSPTSFFTLDGPRSGGGRTFSLGPSAQPITARQNQVWPVSIEPVVLSWNEPRLVPNTDLGNNCATNG